MSIETVAALSLRVDRIQTNVNMQSDANDTKLLVRVADRKLLVLAVAMSRRIQVRAETLLIVLIADMAHRTRTRVMAANRLVSIVARLPRLVSIRPVRRESVCRQRPEIARRRSRAQERLRQIEVVPEADRASLDESARHSRKCQCHRRNDSAVIPTLRLAT